MKKVQVSDQQEDINFEFVYRFLFEQSTWASAIGRETLKRAIDYSLCFSAFIDDNQVGFARVVTDYATFAWVDDVFTDPKMRRRGVAKALITAILGHPELKSVASWWLSSGNPEARSLFQKFDFSVPESERIAKWMARSKIKSDSYQT